MGNLTKSLLAIILATMIALTFIPCFTFAETVDDEPIIDETQAEILQGWSDDHKMFFVDGVAVTGVNAIDGKLYLFKDDGTLLKKKKTFTYNGAKYYGNTSGDGSLKTGYFKIGSYYYAFDPEFGFMLKGYNLIDGKPYYFGSNGKAKGKGWVTVTIDDNSFKCYSTGKGALATNQIRKISKAYYGFDENGFMLTDTIAEFDGNLRAFGPNGKTAAKGWFEFDGQQYYCTGNGALAKGYVNVGGEGFWLGTRDEAGYTYSYEEGEEDFDVIADGQWYRFDGTHKGIAKGWIDDDTRYCIGAGVLATGWYAEDYKAYFFNPEDATLAKNAYVTGDQISDVKDEYYGIYVPESGCIDGDRGEAYARGIAVLNKRGWTLNEAYKYAYKLKYYGRYKFTRETGIAYNANYGFKNGKGNCYVMADTFYVMAKLLGYNIRAIGGTVGPTHPHSWTVIKQDGTWWVYDPNFTNEMKRNGFKITYGTKGTWKYEHRTNYMDMD